MNTLILYSERIADTRKGDVSAGGHFCSEATCEGEEPIATLMGFDALAITFPSKDIINK